jgi:hypothetical protein
LPLSRLDVSERRFTGPYPERPLSLVRGPFPAVAADLGEAPIVFLITM